MLTYESCLERARHFTHVAKMHRMKGDRRSAAVYLRLAASNRRHARHCKAVSR